MFWFFLWVVCAVASFGLVNDQYRRECAEKKTRTPPYDTKFWFVYGFLVLLGPIGVVMAWINNKESYKGAKFDFSFNMDDLSNDELKSDAS